MAASEIRAKDSKVLHYWTRKGMCGAHVSLLLKSSSGRLPSPKGETKQIPQKGSAPLVDL